MQLLKKSHGSVFLCTSPLNKKIYVDDDDDDGDDDDDDDDDC